MSKVSATRRTAEADAVQSRASSPSSVGACQWSLWPALPQLNNTASFSPTHPMTSLPLTGAVSIATIPIPSGRAKAEVEVEPRDTVMAAAPRRNQVSDGKRSQPSEPSTQCSRLSFEVAEAVPILRMSAAHYSSSQDMEKHKEHHRPQEHDIHATSSSEPSQNGRHSRGNSGSTSYETDATSLPPLQTNAAQRLDMMEPLDDADLDPGSFLLVAPAEQIVKQYSLETRSEQLFSAEHLKMLFDDTPQLLRFTSFLSAERPGSIPVLIYYLDAVKALKAIGYANAIAEALEPIQGLEFTTGAGHTTVNSKLEEKARHAFNILVENDLPAYVTHSYIRTVSLSITRRITGTLPLHLREASEGLAEVFCLTDPSRPDNPIVFASEEFHRTTQYGMPYVLGRNCRFLQGPKTNQHSVKRLQEKIAAGQEHSEVFLNYRRDGSPFMNLLMVAPLCDSRGKIRYFIGAQVDVSGLVKECSDFDSLKRLIVSVEHAQDNDMESSREEKKDAFQELSEMLNEHELETVRKCGGRMHREEEEEAHDGTGNAENWNRPRLLIQDPSPDGNKTFNGKVRLSGQLSGIYENYLLVRPCPSLRILFASPSLRVPGILQSYFLAKIGGTTRIQEELAHALAEGRGVTAKIRWVTKFDPDGRSRWIHCTPLIGSNGAVGVWMIVVVDDEKHVPVRKPKGAPPVDPSFGRRPSRDDDRSILRDGRGGYEKDAGSLRDRPGTSNTNLTDDTMDLY